MSRNFEDDLQTAERIVTHAKRVEAGRITFRDSEGFLFSAPDRDELVDFIRIHSPVKYKLQRLGPDGRWRDASKYFPVADSNAVIESLTKVDLSTVKSFSSSRLVQAAEDDPRGFRLAMRRIFGKIAVAPKQSQLEPWKEVINKSANKSASEDLMFLSTTLELLLVMLRHGVDTQFRLSAISAALAELEGLRSRYTSGAGQVAFFIIKGKLLSFKDRSAAAESFERAISLDSNGLIDSFYFDLGVYTYFDLGDNPASLLVKEIQESIEPLRFTNTNNKFAVTVSVDPHFFRIYSPQLYFFAQQLPDLDFVFLVCGERDEVETAISEGETYLQHLVRLNRSGAPRNIQYMYSPVPTFTGQAKTFYACARFFAVDYLLAHYDSVYLLDADLVAEDNPMSYFDRVKQVSFGTATNIDMNVFSPWRRNLAGNVALRESGPLKEVMPDLLGYMAHGLAEDTSWMLDQNALAFAVERHSTAYTPLDEFRRPFSQPRFRATWEKRYFASLE